MGQKKVRNNLPGSLTNQSDYLLSFHYSSRCFDSTADSDFWITKKRIAWENRESIDDFLRALIGPRHSTFLFKFEKRRFEPENIPARNLLQIR